MRIIPVLDLLGGLVVRGVMGERANYRPIATPLSASPEPVAVARALSAVGRFERFYLADLDAIAGRPGNAAALDALREALPGTEFWVDAGVRDAAAARAMVVRPGCVCVAGSESLDGAPVLEALAGEAYILSLDFKGDEFLGDPVILANPSLWPARVIVMTLARVGSGNGPDLARLAQVRALAGGRDVYAAGGVRNAGDLDALEAAGIAGVLVASALHDGRLAGRLEDKR